MAKYVNEINRVTRSKEEARVTYDKISKWYDVLEGVWEKTSTIYVQKALEEAGFQCHDVKTATVFRMPVEIVLAVKPVQ